MPTAAELWTPNFEILFFFTIKSDENVNMYFNRLFRYE